MKELSDDPLQKRIAWFAPWRWSRRARCTAAGLLPLVFAAYLLSRPFVIYLLVLTGGVHNPLILDVVTYGMYPADIIDSQCPPLSDLNDALLSWLIATFGLPTDP